MSEHLVFGVGQKMQLICTHRVPAGKEGSITFLQSTNLYLFHMNIELKNLDPDRPFPFFAQVFGNQRNKVLYMHYTCG